MNFKIYNPGNRPSAADLTARQQELTRLGRINMPGSVTQHNGGGPTILVPPVHDWIPARVTAVDGRKHAWKIMRAARNGQWEEVPHEAEKTIARDPAFEVNDVIQLPGTLVKVRRGKNRIGGDGQLIQEWLFRRCCQEIGSGSGSGEGSGSGSGSGEGGSGSGSGDRGSGSGDRGSGSGSGFPPSCCCSGTLPDTLCLHYEWASVNIFGTVCASGTEDLVLRRCAVSGTCSPCNDPAQAESVWCWDGAAVHSGLCIFPFTGATTSITLQEVRLCCSFDCQEMALSFYWSGLGPVGDPCCESYTDTPSGTIVCDPFDWQVDRDLSLFAVFGCRDAAAKQFNYNYDWHLTECA